MPTLCSSLTHRSRAFTLIELLVVILIIAILIAVAAPSFLGQQDKARDSETKQDLTVLYKAAKADAVDNPAGQGVYRTDSTDPTLVEQLVEAEPRFAGALVYSDADPTEKGSFTVSATGGSLTAKGLSDSGHLCTLTAPQNAALTVTCDDVDHASGDTNVLPASADLAVMRMGGMSPSTIVVTNADGSSNSTIATTRVAQMDMTRAPDGRLAYAANGRVHFVDPDGTNPTSVDAGCPSVVSTVRFTASKMIVSCADNGADTRGVWVSNMDGSDRVRIESEFASTVKDTRGNRLLLTMQGAMSCDQSGGVCVYAINVDGSGKTKLTTASDGSDARPVFDNDGSVIYRSSGSSNLYHRANDGTVTQLTNDMTFQGGGVDVAPDGRIAYEDGNRNAIRILNRGTGTTTNVPGWTGQAGDLVWQR